MQQPTNPMRKEEWEEEFDNTFDWIIKLGELFAERPVPNFKSFIRQLLLSARQEADQRVRDAVRGYDELIMAVASKYPNETRHETALRYIKSAEDRVSSAIKSTQV